MEINKLKSILKEHNLRITNCRVDVFQYFLEENRALSQHDLETEFKNYDRVTLYRTLNNFLQSGILHKIPNESGLAKYGLCHNTCTPHHHTHDHVHFKCNSCGKIECLDEPLTYSPVNLPKGYVLESINLIIDGNCSKCSA